MGERWIFRILEAVNGSKSENFTSIPLEGIRDDKVSYPVDGRMNVCWS